MPEKETTWIVGVVCDLDRCDLCCVAPRRDREKGKTVPLCPAPPRRRRDEERDRRAGVWPGHDIRARPCWNSPGMPESASCSPSSGAEACSSCVRCVPAGPVRRSRNAELLYLHSFFPVAVAAERGGEWVPDERQAGMVFDFRDVPCSGRIRGECGKEVGCRCRRTVDYLCLKREISIS